MGSTEVFIAAFNTAEFHALEHLPQRCQLEQPYACLTFLRLVRAKRSGGKKKKGKNFSFELQFWFNYSLGQKLRLISFYPNGLFLLCSDPMSLHLLYRHIEIKKALNLQSLIKQGSEAFHAKLRYVFISFHPCAVDPSVTLISTMTLQ